MRPSGALALVLLLAGCSRGPGAVHVVSVRTASGSLAEPLREAGVDDSGLDDAARLALRDAGFALGEGSRSFRAEVDVVGVRLAPPDASGGPPRGEVSVGIALSPAEPGKGSTVRETGTAAESLGAADPREAWRRALAAAARKAADGLALAFSEDAKPLEQVIEDLASKDVRVRDHAVRVLAERRSPAAVPALIERLKDGDLRIVHRAVGALAQIGDERAVGPLIELSRSRDPVLAARVARLIGDIGGAEAEGYLLTLESGHPDARVRKAAREALDEMDARAEQRRAVAARK